MIQHESTKILAIIDNGTPTVCSYSESGTQIFPDKLLWCAVADLSQFRDSPPVPPHYLILSDGSGFDMARLGNNVYNSSSEYFAKTLGDGASVFTKCGYGISFEIVSSVSQSVRIVPTRMYSTQSTPACQATIDQEILSLNAGETIGYSWNGILVPTSFANLWTGSYPSNFQYTWVYGASFMCDTPGAISISNLKYGWSFA